MGTETEAKEICKQQTKTLQGMSVNEANDDTSAHNWPASHALQQLEKANCRNTDMKRIAEDSTILKLESVKQLRPEAVEQSVNSSSLKCSCVQQLTAMPWNTLPITIMAICSEAAKMMAAIINRMPLYLHDNTSRFISAS